MCATHDGDEAQAKVEELAKEGFSGVVVETTDWENLNDEHWYVVTAGVYDSESDANTALPGVQGAGFTGAYVKWTGAYQGSEASIVTDTDLAELESIGWYTDESGRISSSSVLESGLEYFYQRTGVRAYLYILPDGTVDGGSAAGNKAMELYSDVFDDLGGKFPVFMVVFCDGDGTYSLGGSASEKARTIMGDGYFNSFGETLHEAFSSTETDEEGFSAGFRAFADEVTGGSSE